MRNEDFDTPKRVWVNCPSKLQPYHNIHGKVGIAVRKIHSAGADTVELHFTEGAVHSMLVNPLYLELKN